MSEPVRLLSAEQVAQRTNLGRTTVFGLIASGDIESIKIGKLRRVPVEAVDAFIEKLRAEQGTAA